MPKHYLYPTPNPDGTNSDRRLELHWQRDLFVSLASTRWAGEGEPDTALEFLTAETSADSPEQAWPGETITLDRQQINHLIRQLRSARDQAFGRDE